MAVARGGPARPPQKTPLPPPPPPPTPSLPRTGRPDTVAATRLGRALSAPLYADAAPHPVNIARYQFLNPAGRDFFPDWDTALNATVSLLRTEAGRSPHDSDLTGLIGELV